VRRAASVVDLSATKGSTSISRATDEAWQRRRREVEAVFAEEILGVNAFPSAVLESE